MYKLGPFLPSRLLVARYGEISYGISSVPQKVKEVRSQVWFTLRVGVTWSKRERERREKKE
jgi:hypothetical protein